METKHTPGPWIIGHNALGMHGITTSDFSVTVVEHIYVDTEEKEANAHLIAQAPDLLAALEECADKLEDSCDELLESGRCWKDECLECSWNKAAQQARSIIAKAKGEQHARP